MAMTEAQQIRMTLVMAQHLKDKTVDELEALEKFVIGNDKKLVVPTFEVVK